MGTLRQFTRTKYGTEAMTVKDTCMTVRMSPLDSLLHSVLIVAGFGNTKKSKSSSVWNEEWSVMVNIYAECGTEAIHVFQMYFNIGSNGPFTLFCPTLRQHGQALYPYLSLPVLDSPCLYLPVLTRHEWAGG